VSAAPQSFVLLTVAGDVPTRLVIGCGDLAIRFNDWLRRKGYAVDLAVILLEQIPPRDAAELARCDRLVTEYKEEVICA
jgi:hypothetical protein